MSANQRARASRFVEEWSGETHELGEAQSFWNEFFEIFCRSRKAVAIFERQARRLGKHHGYIDLFWAGKLIVEHKSAGRSLDEAMRQAEEYVVDLPDDQKPRYLLVCDFVRFYLVDLQDGGGGGGGGREYKFTLGELPDNVELFGFMTDRPAVEQDIDPVNQKATKMMGRIYKSLADSGYPSGETERLLTRLAFCMFADDVGIFDHGVFGRFLSATTPETLGPMLASLFQTLNTPERKDGGVWRKVDLDFPYVDGQLFESSLTIAEIGPETRDLLIKADTYDWSKINPAIFGAMFQQVMSADEHRAAGAHYTTEENIMRVIRPLFLDDLRTEFEGMRKKRGRGRRVALEKFQDKLAGLRFLDPACGSGNFLTIAYRELRRLELDVILLLHDTRDKKLDVSVLSKVNVHQFYGMDLGEFPTRIAEISMWMTDHLMNRELGQRYGEAYARIPLEQSPNIRCCDALETDWEDVLPAAECDYILGNPPYLGSKVQTPEQRKQVRQIASLGGTGGTLDYVTAWFLKAAVHMGDNPSIRTGFVATNSICQGEQVGQLWPLLLDMYGLDIEFAYRTFKWGSDAPGIAHVHVVIIGLGRSGRVRRRLFHTDGAGILEENSTAISPYLTVGGSSGVIMESSRPLNGLPNMIVGSKPIDGGHYIFTDEQRAKFLADEPGAEPYMRPYIGAKEFIQGGRRWILYLHEIGPGALRKLPLVKDRVGKVRQYRLASRAPSTRRLAEVPREYHLNVIPGAPFLLIPRVSSEARKYIPIGYVEPPTIPSDSTMIVWGASLGLFGLLTSRMHMVWLAEIGGNLETRYRYSAGLVYNTFPVPTKPLGVLDPYAQAVLDARAAEPDSTLADLYDSDAMHPCLARAHRRLDTAVDRLYRKKSFSSDLERIEFLLGRYATMATKASDKTSAGR